MCSASAGRRRLCAALLAAGLGVAAPGAGAQTAPSAAPVVVSGVAYAPTAVLQGQPLVLQGAGTRYKAIFKVYTAGLYLEKPAASLPDIARLPGPKRLSVTMLRGIDAKELGQLFTRGMEDNMDKAAFSRLIPGVLRMSEVFSQHKRLQTGDSFVLDWLPGQGMVLNVKGEPQGEAFKEPEFFLALLGIWLGPQPADGQLKEALLRGPQQGAPAQ